MADTAPRSGNGSTPPSPETLEGEVYSFGKAAGDSVAIQSNAADIDDEFEDFYVAPGAPHIRGKVVLRPPYDPWNLQKNVSENNALLPCIDAMEANIDGTGYVIEPVEIDEVEEGGDEPKKKGKPAKTEDDKLREQLEAFFDEPWPGMSFTTMRKKLRRDVEKTGFTFLEVLRNPKGEIMFTRPVDARNVRLVKLDEPVPTPVMVERGGRKFEATVMMRHRRYVQVVRRRLVYFKDYGTKRDLNKDTGEWADKGTQFSAEVRATELLYLTVHRDDRTPYGVPRWVNQAPSVVGSRRAEESNLKFFETGGVPPIMIVVSGGQLAEKTVTALRSHFNRDAADKHQALIIEAYSTQGTLDEKSAVKVQVERFSGEQQNDAMFREYDKDSERRVRRAFRLPPLFVGMAEDYSFASVFASYTVAEAQVFKPERDEFDEIINLTIMRELDADQKFRYRSLPLQVNDVANQLKGLDLMNRGKTLTRRQLLESVAEVVNVEVDYDEEALLNERDKFMPALPGFGGDPSEATRDGDGDGQVGEQGKPGAPKGPPANDQGTPGDAPAPNKPATVKKIDPTEFSKATAMADEAVEVLYGWGGRGAYDKLMTSLGSLTPGEMNLFKAVLAVKMYDEPDLDPEGLAALSAASLAVMHANGMGDA